MLTARIRGVSETRPDQRSARSPSSLLGESVTGAIQRFDSVELGIELTEFTANPLDVAVDRAVVDIDVVVIGRIHQLVARFHDAGPLRQRLQDQELGDGLCDGLAVPGVRKSVVWGKSV